MIVCLADCFARWEGGDCDYPPEFRIIYAVFCIVSMAICGSMPGGVGGEVVGGGDLAGGFRGNVGVGGNGDFGAAIYGAGNAYHVGGLLHLVGILPPGMAAMAGTGGQDQVVLSFLGYFVVAPEVERPAVFPE